MADPQWNPDYGPDQFNSKSGTHRHWCSRFLVTYNVNLNTTSTRRANAIAFDVREQGRIKVDKAGKNIVDEEGIQSNTGT